MTFMLTAVSVRGSTGAGSVEGALALDPAPVDAAMAGYLPGLTRHLGRSIEGQAYYVVTDEGGYRSSNVLFPYPESDEEPVRLAVPGALRQQFDAILRDLLLSSPEGSVVLVSEYNGTVTDPHSADDVEVEVLGPWSRSEFWRHHDLGDVLEESIVIIEEKGTHR